MRDVDQALNVRIVQPIIQGFITARAVEVMKKYSFSLLRTKTFIKTHLKWSYRCATTAYEKLPLNWQQQGFHMAYRVSSEGLQHTTSISCQY